MKKLILWDSDFRHSNVCQRPAQSSSVFEQGRQPSQAKQRRMVHHTSNVNSLQYPPRKSKCNIDVDTAVLRVMLPTIKMAANGITKRKCAPCVIQNKDNALLTHDQNVSLRMTSIASLALRLLTGEKVFLSICLKSHDNIYFGRVECPPKKRFMKWLSRKLSYPGNDSEQAR